jgi:hypothetical protein
MHKSWVSLGKGMPMFYDGVENNNIVECKGKMEGKGKDREMLDV